MSHIARLCSFESSTDDRGREIIEGQRREMANVLCFYGYIVYGTWQSIDFVSCWLHVLRCPGNVERRGHRRSDSLSFRNVPVACCNTRRLASHRREHNPPISGESNTIGSQS